MRSLNFVSIKLTLGLVLGIVLGFYFEIGYRLSFYGLAGLLVLLYFFKNRRSKDGAPFFGATVLLSTLLLGVLVVSLSQKPPHHFIQSSNEKELVWHLKIKEELKPNDYSQNYVAEVVGIGNQKGSGKLLLRLWADSTAQHFLIDDELLAYAKSSQISPPLNPHQFNYMKYLQKQGIQKQIRVAIESVIVQRNPSRTIWGLASEARKNIIEGLKTESFGHEELAVIQALLLGQRNDISESIYNDYKNAGAVHILAVSGLHVGILLLLLEFLLAPLQRFPGGAFLKFAAIVLLLWAYAFIAGLSPSVVRAVTMFSFFAYAIFLNRPSNSFNIIALSMFFILLIKPLMLFQVGFQMSYAAVIAIVWIYPKLLRFWSPKSWLVRKIWQLLSVSTAAQLGVVPISLFYFHQFPSLFFVSNLLIIPFLGFILSIGVLVIFLSLLDYLPIWLVELYNWVIGMMNSVVNWVAEQESFVLRDIPFDGIQLLLTYGIIISLVALLSQPKWKYAFMVGMGIMGMQMHVIWNEWQLKSAQSILLLHQSKNTVMFHQQGENLHVYAKDTIRPGRLISNYSVSERVKYKNISPLKNYYSINGKTLYIMDSLGLYPHMDKPDYLILTQSPKVNLERVLDSIKPKMILADGSNYRSYIQRWQKTCSKKEIPFHFTGEKGYFVFKPDPD